MVRVEAQKQKMERKGSLSLSFGCVRHKALCNNTLWVFFGATAIMFGVTVIMQGDRNFASIV